jgi:hypothetical protein
VDVTALSSSAPHGGIPGGDTSSLEALITERIRTFEFSALLDALATCGYSDASIEYRSHRTLLSQGHPIHAIAFEHYPRKRVVITVNLGLLSAQSPLPSFFLKAMDESDHDVLEDFLGYFDHHLLRARIASQTLDRDVSLVGNKEVIEDRLRLLRPSCPSTLHWLCVLIFPEAEVKVRRITQWQSVASPGLRLGSTALGAGSAVGGFALIPQTGMEVTLCVDELLTSDGTPWALEARRRFSNRLLPWLGESALFLTLLLVLRGHSSHASLRDDSHLAYDPIAGGPERDHVVVLFSGSTSETSRNDLVINQKT